MKFVLIHRNKATNMVICPNLYCLVFKKYQQIKLSLQNFAPCTIAINKTNRYGYMLEICLLYYQKRQGDLSIYVHYIIRIKPTNLVICLISYYLLSQIKLSFQIATLYYPRYSYMFKFILFSLQNKATGNIIYATLIFAFLF